MKSVKVLVVCVIVLLYHPVIGQSTDENAIRKLSALEVESFLKGDTIALAKLWSSQYVVMNPFNKIVNVREIFALMRTSKVNQVRFERVIERITINQNVATEMGLEIPDEMTASGDVARQVLPKRRFTNVWMKVGDNWQLLSRQATNICPQK